MSCTAGDSYEGEWNRDGLPDGEGTYAWAEDGRISTGGSDGNGFGYGTTSYADGDVYERYCRGGLPNGEGTYTSADGEAQSGT